MIVTVRDDAVVTSAAVYVEDNATVPDEVARRLPTMNEQFDEVQGYIDADVESLEVEYHPTLGYVTLIRVDRDAMIADDEETVEVSDLVPIDDGGDEAVDDAAKVAEREKLNSTLHASWELWDSSDVDDYDFVYRLSCFCVEEATRPMKVRVRDDAVVGVVYNDGDDTAVAEDIAKRVPTVNELFDQIEEMIESAHMLNATFNATYGYPTFIDVDYYEGMADDEERIFVSGLVPYGEGEDNGGDGDGDAAKVAAERNATLHTAMKQWETSMGSSSYEYEYRRSCFCFPKDTGVLKVVVRGDGDEVVSVKYAEDNTTVPTEIAQDVPTVNELFDLVQDYINEEADVLNVTYDTQYGYPIELNVDPDEMRTDDGQMIETGNLTPVTVDLVTGGGGIAGNDTSEVRSGGDYDSSPAVAFAGPDGSPFVASLCLLTVVAAVVLA